MLAGSHHCPRRVRTPSRSAAAISVRSETFAALVASRLIKSPWRGPFASSSRPTASARSFARGRPLPAGPFFGRSFFGGSGSGVEASSGTDGAMFAGSVDWALATTSSRGVRQHYVGRKARPPTAPPLRNHPAEAASVRLKALLNERA